MQLLRGRLFRWRQCARAGVKQDFGNAISDLFHNSYLTSQAVFQILILKKNREFQARNPIFKLLFGGLQITLSAWRYCFEYDGLQYDEKKA